MQDGMAILLGPDFCVDKYTHRNPERVGKLEGYQPVELTEDLLEEKVAKPYTGGRNLTVNLLRLESRHVFRSWLLLKPDACAVITYGHVLLVPQLKSGDWRGMHKGMHYKAVVLTSNAFVLCICRFVTC